MISMFEQGDEVILIDKQGNRIDDIIYTVSGVLELPTGEYCYTLYEGNGIYPESILDFAPLEPINLETYEFKNETSIHKTPTYDRLVEEFTKLVDETKKKEEQEKINEALDMYNNFIDLYKMTGDNTYQTLSDIIIAHLKKGTYATIDLIKMLPYLEKEIKKYEGENQ